MPPKPEHAYQKSVKERLTSQGCLVFKIVEKFRSGFPDLIVIRPDVYRRVPFNGGVSFVELKVAPNTPSGLQLLTLNAIAQKGGRAYVLTKQKDGTEKLEVVKDCVLQPASLEAIYKGGL